MTAHVDPNAKLVVKLFRDEELVDSVIASDGYRAQAAAISMIEDIGALQAGDQLIVRYSSDPTLPEASRSSHYSG